MGMSEEHTIATKRSKRYLARINLGMVVIKYSPEEALLFRQRH